LKIRPLTTSPELENWEERINSRLDSNSIYRLVDRMGDIPIRTDAGNKTIFLRDVATPKDDSLIQTNIVRVNGAKTGLHPDLSHARGQHAGCRHLRENLPDPSPGDRCPECSAGCHENESGLAVCCSA
jgi:hypothetical protein